MHALKSAEHGYYAGTRAGQVRFVRARCAAKWTCKQSARRLKTILAGKGFDVRVVSISD
jgi:hypothetical protein